MIKKKLISFLIALLVLLTLLPVTVRAEEKTENGLFIRQITDKEEYSAGENIETTLTVTNTNEHGSDVLDVQLVNLTPEGYELQKDSPAQKDIMTLKAGESVSLTTVFVKTEPEETEESTETEETDESEETEETDESEETEETDEPDETEATDATEETGATDDPEETGATDEPASTGEKDDPAPTGDGGFTGLIIAGIMVVFCLALIVGILIRRKKGKINGIFLSCLLAVGITATLIGGAVMTKAETMGQVTLTTVVSAEGEDLPVKSTVSYGARTAEKYQVTFDGNFEGSEYSEEITETCGDTYVLPETAPERDGYTFAGWFTEAEDGTQVTSETKVELTASQTLYAHWTKDPVKTDKPSAIENLVYNGEEQTGVAEGTGYTLANNKGTAAGDYTATATLSSGYCWQDGSTEPAEISWTIGKASAKVKADDAEKTSGEDDPELKATVTGTFGTDKLIYTVSRAAGETAGTYAITPSGDAVQGSYNVTYEAGTFTINAVPTYEITYYGNGATSGAAPEDPQSPYEKATEVTILGNAWLLQKTGYAFEGWNTKADGSGIHYAPGDKFEIMADMVLYAEWSPAYTLSFSATGCGEAPEPVTDLPSGTTFATSGNTLTVTLPDTTTVTRTVSPDSNHYGTATWNPSSGSITDDNQTVAVSFTGKDCELTFNAGSGVDKLLDAEEEEITDPITVEYGSSYSFTVVLNSAYQKAVVTVGDDEILPSADGVYTISNITGDMSVTATGKKVGYYAVCIWNIEQMIDGSDLVTFGPAAGASYNDAIGSADELEDSWEEIDAAARAGKAHTKYDDAMKNGDVKLIEITGNDYFTPSGTFSAFHLTVRSDYRKWNSTFAGYSSDDPASNYADSRIRATLNGYDVFTPNPKYAGTDCLTRSNCLLSCFPEELQAVITPKTYYVPTAWSASDPYKITAYIEVNDKLWLANANELYGSSAGAQYSDFGTMFRKNNGSPASANKLYRETETATSFWLRSPCRSYSYQVAAVKSSGEAGIYPCDSTANAIAPFFNIGGAYTPEPVTTTYQLATDDNGSWLDDDDMLVSSITVGGTTPPTADEIIEYMDGSDVRRSVKATPNTGYEFDGCTYNEATKTFTATFKAMAVPVTWTPMQKKISDGSTIDFYPAFNQTEDVSGYKFAVKEGDDFFEVAGLSMADIYAALQPASGTKRTTLYYMKTDPLAPSLKGYTVINSTWSNVFKVDAAGWFPQSASSYTDSFISKYVDCGIVTAQLGDASGTNMYGGNWDATSNSYLQKKPEINGVLYKDFYDCYGGINGPLLSSCSDLPWMTGAHNSSTAYYFTMLLDTVSYGNINQNLGIILASSFD